MTRKMSPLKIKLTLAAVWLFSAPVASAAPTFSTDNTTIGTMTSPKNYGSAYSGFWRIGAPDYSLLTDGTNTFVNAPNASGSIYFRQANSDSMSYGPGGVLSVPGSVIVTATTGTTVTGKNTNGAGVTGISTSNIGVQGQSTNHIGVYGTSAGGPLFAGVIGQTTGINSNGVVGRNFTSGANCFSNPDNCPAAVFGDSNFNHLDVWAGNFHGDVNATGEIYSQGVDVLSDARLKRDIKDGSYGLEQVLKLRPVTYKWKKTESRDDEKTNVGLIAQEVQKIVPELVQSRGKSEVLALNYTGLIPVLIKAVQEQQRIIRQQEGRIATLEQGQHPVASSSGRLGAVAAFGLLPLGLIGFAVGRRRKGDTSVR